MIVLLLNLIHLFFVFLPILIFFVPLRYFSSLFKYIFLIIMLIPIHWVFLDNQCGITMITRHYGDLQNSETESGFSEKYLKWLYEPIMNIIGWKWDNDGLNKMVYLHWGVNYILIWYYLFFIGKSKLI